MGVCNMRKQSKETFGQYIKRVYGAEKYHEYRLNYYKARRISKKINASVDVSREAGLQTIYHDTKFFAFGKRQAGITDVTKVTREYHLDKFANFIKEHSNQTYNGVNIGQIVKKYRAGQLTDEEFLSQIDKFKQSDIYILTGSD